MEPTRAVYSSLLGRVLHLALGATAGAAAAMSVAGSLSGWVVLALFAAYAALIPLGSFYAPSGLFGPVLLAGRADRPLVALTFDDGPDPEATPRVLAVLARHGARATFFVIGERAARHPEVMTLLREAGHQIENHSLRHSWYTAFAPPSRLATELERASTIIRQTSGRAPRWLRAPIGVLSPRVFAAAHRAGLRLCGWSGKARDGWSSTSVEAATKRLLAALRPGAILLLHDAPEMMSGAGAATGSTRRPIAPEVLDRLLPLVAARGLRAVTLDELVEAPGRSR